MAKRSNGASLPRQIVNIEEGGEGVEPDKELGKITIEDKYLMRRDAVEAKAYAFMAVGSGLGETEDWEGLWARPTQMPSESDVGVRIFLKSDSMMGFSISVSSTEPD